MGDTRGGPGSSEKGGSFEARLRAARDRQGLDKPAGDASSDPARTSPWGIGLRVGVELVAALAVAVVIGWWLDKWLGTRPWLLVLFIVLGGAAGVLNVYRMLMPSTRGRRQG